MKTNKAFLKRFRVTRQGKLLHRAIGQDHFNAKEKRRRQLGKHRMKKAVLSQRLRRRFGLLKCN